MHLDPIENIIAGCGESFRRVALAPLSLLVGSFFAMMATIGTIALSASLHHVLPSFWPPFRLSFFHLTDILAFPLFPFLSGAIFLAAPNSGSALFYFTRTDDPTIRRFLLHAYLQQLAAMITSSTWFYDGGASTRHLVTLGISFFLLQLVSAALLAFSVGLLKNRYRVNHEEHLMGIAVQTEMKRRELATKVHIPAPPSGVAPPKPRELSPSTPPPEEALPPPQNRGDERP